MSKATELAELHQIIGDLRRCVTSLQHCGGVLLAEDSPGHRAHFAADREALFFRDVDDEGVGGHFRR